MTISMAVVGATGAVGVEVRKILEQRSFPVSSTALHCFASEKSAGQYFAFHDRNALRMQTLHDGCFDGIDIAIFSAGSEVSKKWAPIARDAGTIVIDNSSAFRMHDDVPLVVPEINGEDVKKHKGIIANPNCTTAITLMALYPLHHEFGVKRIIASSYQAVSGAGARGILELSEQISANFSHRKIAPSFFPHQIAFNVFPHVDSFQPSGYTKEEEKMQNEGRKIMHHPTFKASVTCVRVPVYRAHSIAVSAEFERPITAADAVAVLHGAEGVQVEEIIGPRMYPTPLDATGKDDCLVGRIRKDSAFDNGLSFFVCGDQLRKGAALNAVQIAELLIK